MSYSHAFYVLHGVLAAVVTRMAITTQDFKLVDCLSLSVMYLQSRQTVLWTFLALGIGEEVLLGLLAVF